jgi:hypothetical protein
VRERSGKPALKRNGPNSVRHGVCGNPTGLSRGSLGSLLRERAFRLLQSHGLVPWFVRIASTREAIMNLHGTRPWYPRIEKRPVVEPIMNFHGTRPWYPRNPRAEQCWNGPHCSRLIAFTSHRHVVQARVGVAVKRNGRPPAVNPGPRLFRPSGAPWIGRCPQPTAYAVGYFLSPLWG